MNPWTQLSVDFANQRNYLDELFSVYPTIPEGIREINQTTWNRIEHAFNENDNDILLKLLLKLDLFPIKDSYIAYLKRDPSSIDRNPQTVNRISGRLHEMGLTKIQERCTEPKETNRQIGPLFRRWIQRNVIGVPLLPLSEFRRTTDNAILDIGDAALMNYARQHHNYTRDKGLDLIARFNGNIILGEAKFLTDFGGHQNAQFADGISTLRAEVNNAQIIGIYDGVCYIRGNNKMYKFFDDFPDFNIMSALVLREFLYQI